MRGSIYVGIALSGATALGAQVVWTRLMAMLLGVVVSALGIAVFFGRLAPSLTVLLAGAVVFGMILAGSLDLTHLLSLVAKSALAWQVFSATLAG
jgi:hypothetical protein